MARCATLLAVCAGLLALAMGAVPAHAGTKVVRLTADLKFAPADKYIAVNETVEWVYSDSSGSSQHTVTSTSSEQFNSSTNCPAVLSDDCIDTSRTTFRHTFNNVGDFTYECRIHTDSGMIGTIHVRPAASTATPTATQSTHTPTSRPSPSLSPSPSDSPSPSPSDTSLASPSPSDSPAASGQDGGGGAGGRIAIAVAAVLALGVLGYFVYARYVSPEQ